MIITKEEVEKAADKFDHNVKLGDLLTTKIFKAGVEFAESTVYEYVKDIIIENQGLKLYKDNEAERFKGLAVEFGNWIGRKEYSYYSPGSDIVPSWFDKNNHSLDCNTNELFETFIKERNEADS